MDKSAGKSVGAANLRPFANGPDARRGRGPKKGAPNAGRPPEEWRAWLKSVIDGPEARAQLAAILTDADHPAYARVLALGLDRTFGSVAQQHQHSGPDGQPLGMSLTVRLIDPPDDADAP